jgi:hypothetical protein
MKEKEIVAEHAADAGLTQDAAFPMMKNQSLTTVVGRWSLVIRGFFFRAR